VNDPHPCMSDVLDLMRRLGMHDRIEQAQRELPETIDLTGDGELLAALGLDAVVNQLGGSAW
jgi:hypothetical protein